MGKAMNIFLIEILYSSLIFCTKRDQNGKIKDINPTRVIKSNNLAKSDEIDAVEGNVHIKQKIGRGFKATSEGTKFYSERILARKNARLSTNVTDATKKENYSREINQSLAKKENSFKKKVLENKLSDSHRLNEASKRKDSSKNLGSKSNGKQTRSFLKKEMPAKYMLGSSQSNCDISIDEPKIKSSSIPPKPNQLRYSASEKRLANKRTRLNIIEGQQHKTSKSKKNIKPLFNKAKIQRKIHTSGDIKTITYKLSKFNRKICKKKSKAKMSSYSSSKTINTKPTKEIIPGKFGVRYRKRRQDAKSKNISSKYLNQNFIKPNSRTIARTYGSINRQQKKTFLNLEETYDEYINHLQNLAAPEAANFLYLLAKNEIILLRNKKNRVENENLVLDYTEKIKNEFEEILNDISERRIFHENHHSDDIIDIKTDININSFIEFLLEKMQYLKSLDIECEYTLDTLFTTCQDIIEYERNIFKDKQGEEILKHINILDINESIKLIAKESRYMVLSETFYILSLYGKDINNFIKKHNVVYISFLLRIFATYITKILPNSTLPFEIKYKEKENRYGNTYYLKIFNLRKIFFNILLGIKGFDNKAFLYQLLNVFDLRQKIIYHNKISEEYLLFRSKSNLMFVFILLPEFRLKNKIFLREVIVIFGMACFATDIDPEWFNNKLTQILNSYGITFSNMCDICYRFLQKDIDIFDTSIG